MARYRITVKISARSAGMVIEPGMSIEIASHVSTYNSSNPQRNK